MVLKFFASLQCVIHAARLNFEPSSSTTPAIAEAVTAVEAKADPGTEEVIELLTEPISTAEAVADALAERVAEAVAERQ